MCVIYICESDFACLKRLSIGHKHDLYKGSKKQKTPYDMGKIQKKYSITRSTFNMTTKPTWPSHDEEQRHCIENKMLFGTHRHNCGVWISQITQSWQERQIRVYPRNINLPVLGQENLPLNRLQLLSSEERGRKRKKDIWNWALWFLSTCCRLSDSLASLHENSWHCFSFLHSHTRCNLPALFK